MMVFIALKKLAPQVNETYFIGDFNINLFFKGNCILKKHTQNLNRFSQTKTAKILLRDTFSFSSNSNDE